MFTERYSDRLLSRDELLERYYHIKDEYSDMWAEVEEIRKLLEELGITGYKLSGNTEKPSVLSIEVFKR